MRPRIRFDDLPLEITVRILKGVYHERCPPDVQFIFQSPRDSTTGLPIVESESEPEAGDTRVENVLMACGLIDHMRNEARCSISIEIPRLRTDLLLVSKKFSWAAQAARKEDEAHVRRILEPAMIGLDTPDPIFNQNYNGSKRNINKELKELLLDGRFIFTGGRIGCSRSIMGLPRWLFYYIRHFAVVLPQLEGPTPMYDRHARLDVVSSIKKFFLREENRLKADPTYNTPPALWSAFWVLRNGNPAAQEFQRVLDATRILAGDDDDDDDTDDMEMESNYRPLEIEFGERSPDGSRGRWQILAGGLTREQYRQSGLLVDNSDRGSWQFSLRMFISRG